MEFIKNLLSREPVTDHTITDSYHTIFGFNTGSKVAAITIDIVYWFIIFVAYCFAFHALSAILITWHWVLTALASFAVVGLPYCVKIILFGRKEFPIKAALLCLFLSLIPTIFDFAGLYSETGVQDSLKSSKDNITETLSYFEAESKKAVQMQDSGIRNSNRDKKTEIENTILVRSTETKKQIEEINQEAISERQGVRGKAGDGPRAKELQAEARKLQAQSDIQLQSTKNELKKRIDSLDQEMDESLKALKQSSNLLGDKIVICKKNIDAASNFSELQTSVIDANSLISSIASNLNIKFTPVRITGTDNIIKVSFTALMCADITALICFLLAFLMEIGDIIITFTMRYEKQKQKTVINNDHSEYSREVRYSKTYEGY